MTSSIMTFMKKAVSSRTLVVLLGLLPVAAPGQEAGVSSPVQLDSPWKRAVYAFAEQNLQHTAWGLQHYERNYLLASELAAQESIPIDDDVLFAAAFLHDMGTFEPYVVAGAEHSATAADVVNTVLEDSGFPMEKLDAVKSAILAHMYYAEVPGDATAQVLHDADTLDFLGVIGVTRILSLTTRHGWATDLQTAIATLENFAQQLPGALVTRAARSMADERVAEMEAFLVTLRQQSGGGQAL